MGFASLESQVSVPFARTFTGTATPGDALVSLPTADLVSYIRVNLTEPSCGMRLYLANESDAIAFNDTGQLPSSWIGCSNRSANVGGDIVALVLANPGPTAVPYEIDVQAILVQTPFDWLALPGMVLALAGLLAFVPRFILHEMLRSPDGLGEKRKKK